LLGVPGLWQLGVFCSVDDVLFRHVIIAGVAKWLDRCVLIEPSSARKEKKRAGTYVPSAMQHIVELVSKLPFPRILVKLDGKERRSLRPRPCVPVSLVRVVVHKCGVTAVLPFLVVLGHFGQIPILVDIVRKDENASLGSITKAGRRRSWEFAKQHGWIRSHVEALVGGEKDRDGVDARRLAFLIGDNMSDSAVIEPEGLSAVG